MGKIVLKCRILIALCNISLICHYIECLVFEHILISTNNNSLKYSEIDENNTTIYSKT